MVSITKHEAQLIREAIPYACITKTVHKRYVSEEREVLNLLKKIRSTGDKHEQSH